jgi:hypothetical protein
MSKSRAVTKIQDLEMQLEEALQMLRLVANNQRTCLEVQDWLDINYPNLDQENPLVSVLKDIKYD